MNWLKKLSRVERKKVEKLNIKQITEYTQR